MMLSGWIAIMLVFSSGTHFEVLLVWCMSGLPRHSVCFLQDTFLLYGLKD
jgi:hypothetical protein